MSSIDALFDDSPDMVIDYVAAATDYVATATDYDAAATDYVAAPIRLDAYQEEALQRSITDDNLIIAAGPGSGKTTTICEIIAQSAQHPESRVLVLVFNICAQETIDSRLESKGVNLMNKKSVSNQGAYGAAVLTFDKFAHQVNIAPATTHDELAFICDSIYGEDADAVPTSTNTSERSYRSRIEDAIIKVSKYGFGFWTHIIIDEAQDVNQYHAILINSLYEFSNQIECMMPIKQRTKLIVAGDPRQELYEGATWFSHLWSDRPDSEKIILKYNHRSTPKIVSILNAYSKHHFPTIHHDQISARVDSDHSDHQSNFYVIEHSHNKINGFRGTNTMAKLGKKCADKLYNLQPSEAYVVVPITTTTWDLSLATTALRQHISTIRPGYNAIDCTGDDNLPKEENIYIIANAKKIKGTERNKVVIFGADNNYDLKFDKATQIKSLFVALSRAKDSLSICIRRGAESYLDLILPVIRELDPQYADQLPQHTSKQLSSLYFIKVTGTTDAVERGISTVEGIIPVILKKLISPTITLDKSAIDPDFTGCFAESLIAWALDVRLHGIDGIRFKVSIKKHKWGFYKSDKDQRYVYCNNKYNVESRQKLVCNIKELCCGESDAYAETVARYSINAGALWEISSRFRKIPDNHAANVAAFIRKLFGDNGIVNNVIYSKMCGFNIVNITGKDRSNGKDRPCIWGIPDFIINDIPIEIKYVEKLTDDHRRQSATYATMIGAKYTILLNANDGCTEYIKAISSDELKSYGFAIIIMNNARSAFIGREMPLAMVSECTVTVDCTLTIYPIIISVHQRPDNTRSALAFYGQGAGVISCFDGSIEDFEKWVCSFSSIQTFITWGQDIGKENQIDVAKIWEAKKKLDSAQIQSIGAEDTMHEAFSYLLPKFENQFINRHSLKSYKHLVVAAVFANIVRPCGRV